MDINKLLESIKPLNLGRRFMFQKYCKFLVKEGQIKECDVEKFLSEKFLFEDDIEDLIDKIKKFINFVINVGTVYVVYRIIKKFF